MSSLRSNTRFSDTQVKTITVSGVVHLVTFNVTETNFYREMYTLRCRFQSKTCNQPHKQAKKVTCLLCIFDQSWGGSGYLELNC